ncbi:metallophosphoesterase [Pseudomaricurvus sp. HS19]|uniref:metallophosphoesterase n=1 Tax=Pseudomaricurvus sp. HS19 TaxID=2692626 RepID=UPI00136F9338|nr:serine/threonine protein phosphatase [Pseudomaricurvus sp. HS19]
MVTASESATDIIGDVHGCCDALERLLQKLGYEHDGSSYHHPQGRRAVFVGDLLDRGPAIPQTVQLVKAMCDSGNASMVMGNHEYLALRNASACREYMEHGSSSALSERLVRLMHATLEQYRHNLPAWDELIGWLMRLPLFIENRWFRVVHACWDQALIDRILEQYGSGHMSPRFFSAAQSQGSSEARTIDRLTRGINIPLPEGMQVEGKDGFVRRFFRTKFWANSPQTYGDLVFQPDPLPYGLDEEPIQPRHQDDLVYYPADAVPVFFGHYWLTGRPAPLRHNIACLDYSAVNFGRLTAYRFDGEENLSKEKFVWVYHDPTMVDDSELYDE